MTVFSQEQAQAALQPLASVLRADGYGLTVAIRGTTVEVDVSATESACPECLAPKQIFESIALEALKDGGVFAQKVSVLYPADVQH